MSEQRNGFSNALLIMLSEDTSCSTPIEKLSIECTPGTTPNVEKVKTANRLLSGDLIKRLEESSPVKPFSYFEEEECKKSLFSLETAAKSGFYRYNQAMITYSEELNKTKKQNCSGWYCGLCNNFNYESKI